MDDVFTITHTTKTRIYCLMNFDDVGKDFAMYPKKIYMSITTTTKNSKELSVAKSDSSWAYSRLDGESQIQLQQNLNPPPSPWLLKGNRHRAHSLVTHPPIMFDIEFRMINKFERCRAISYNHMYVWHMFLAQHLPMRKFLSIEGNELN